MQALAIPCDRTKNMAKLKKIKIDYIVKKFSTVRFLLSVLLLISLVCAGFGVYYKIKYWGFSFLPNQKSNIWAVEAHVSFVADGSPIKVDLAIPSKSKSFKILEENIIADGYKVSKNADNIVFTARNMIGEQDLYYKIMVFDNTGSKYKLKDKEPQKLDVPLADENTLAQVNQIWHVIDENSGDDKISALINLFNQEPMDPALKSYLPVQYSQKRKVEIMQELLAFKGIASRISRGVVLEEGQKVVPDLMLEVYDDGAWRLYSPETGQRGMPENFLLFQQGGKSLLDVVGGENSQIRFSLQKSITSTMNLASKRAQLKPKSAWYNYSIYNLPIAQQNMLKWLSVFPIAILFVVLMRNVVGLRTMGTFTPMLIAMSFVQTGLLVGAVCFTVLVSLGLLIRFVLSKLNLLLVPRISAVVIFVILIITAMTFLGYNLNIKVMQASAYFPIIITAWVIERASIIWEENGMSSACKELGNSLIVGIFVYFVIANSYIQHIMFVFNEFNLVILFIVMLLGTYTGYRLTELKRFAPLTKKNTRKSNV